MKTLLALVLTVSAISVAAQAKAPQYYTFDMSGAAFKDNGFNLMGDDVAAGPNEDETWAGMQIKLDGTYGSDFTVKVKATHSEDKCGIDEIVKIPGGTLVRISADPDTDSGDTCDYSIRYRNGRHATLSIESTGT